MIVLSHPTFQGNNDLPLFFHKSLIMNELRLRRLIFGLLCISEYFQ